MPSHSPKSVTEVDVHVGSRVQLRRKYLNMTQERLGDLLGVTFQQVQKYERGANRIGASRLYDLARVLDVPITYFFEGIGEGELDCANAQDDESSTLKLMQSRDEAELAQAFSRIKTPKVRRGVIELMRALCKS